MTAQWKRQAQRAEERRALDLLERAIKERGEAIQRLAEKVATPDPRGRVKLYCGRCGQEMTSIERHYEQHGGMPLAKEVTR